MALWPRQSLGGNFTQYRGLCPSVSQIESGEVDGYLTSTWEIFVCSLLLSKTSIHPNRRTPFDHTFTPVIFHFVDGHWTDPNSDESTRGSTVRRRGRRRTKENPLFRQDDWRTRLRLRLRPNLDPIVWRGHRAKTTLGTWDRPRSEDLPSESKVETDSHVSLES